MCTERGFLIFAQGPLTAPEGTETTQVSYPARGGLRLFAGPGTATKRANFAWNRHGDLRFIRFSQWESIHASRFE